MPINAELFDGTILEFPDNTDPSVIQATAARITEEKQIKQNTSNLGDIGTAFKQGVVGAGKSLTDIAGADNAASQYLGGIQERLGKQYRPQRIEEMQRRQQIIDEAVKSGSTLEEIKAYLGGVAEAPVQSIAQATGSFAPYVAAGALGAGARVAGLAVPAARTINTGIGALQGTGAIKGSIYENVKSKLEARGESPEIAAEKASQAQAYSMANAPQLGLGAVLGAAAGRYGAESLVTPGVATRLNANMLPRAGMAALSEAPFEGLQAGQEQYATNVALGREGFDVDPMQGVIGSAARDAAIGAITAAPIGAIRRGETAPPKPVLEPTKAQESEELAKQSDPNIYNPAVRESAPQIAAMLLPEMKRFGLENVGLKVMDSIENGRADGMWANNLIHVALDKPNPMGSMRHESIHALRELGGFQENEWSALTNKAKSDWLKTFIKDTGKYEQYKKIYQQDNKTLAGFDSYIQEEAIAEAFRYFDKNGAPEGMIGAIYEKLKLMFEAMRNGFTGAGFQSADSIFRSIESGTRDQVAPAGEVLNAARFSQPDTRRINMDFKDVTKRVPELTEAAKKVEAGEMTAAQYDKLVNRYKTITAYDFVPEPTPRALAEEGLAASDEKKIARYGKTEQIPKGHPVGLRLDIPAYTKKGAWVNTIHNEASGDQKGAMPYSSMYSNVSAVKNATFEVPQRMIKVATGEQNKYPDARIMGNWQPINEKQAVAQAKKALNDPAWTQVGMDPERHSYFYDRKTTQPILSADEVIQIGPLVLAKNAKFGSKKDFKYSLGDERKYKLDIKREVRKLAETASLNDEESNAVVNDAQKIAENFLTSQLAEDEALDQNKVDARAKKIVDTATKDIVDTKKRYPASEGWADLTVKGLEAGIDKKGNLKVAPSYQAIAYGFNKADANKVATKFAQEIVKIYARANKGDKNAKNIIAHQNWYKNVAKLLRQEYGGFGDIVADLLGSTSPNTPVDTNFNFSMDVMRRFVRGDFDKEMAAFVKHVDGKKKVSEFPDENKIRQISGKLYGMNSVRAMEALADLWKGIKAGQAPKAKNFAANLIGKSDMATIDVWAARMLRRSANLLPGIDLPRIPPPAEKGVTGLWNAKATAVTGEYGFGAEVLEKVSKLLKERTNLKKSVDLDPPSLQAIAWFAEKELWGKKNWTTKVGEGGSFEENFEKNPATRFLAGISAQKGDVAPKQQAVQEMQDSITSVLKSDPTVIAVRAMPTKGLYGGTVEEALDTEWVVEKDKFDPTQVVSALANQALVNEQYDLFVSKVLAPNEVSDNARPGVEIYFKDEKALNDVKPILDKFTSKGQDGFTLVVDPRAKEGQYIGVRLQYVPEISMRWDEDLRRDLANPAYLSKVLKEKFDALDDIVAEISGMDGVAQASPMYYDTLVIGKENYNDYIIGSDSARKDTKARSKVWFGQPIRNHVKAAASRYGQPEGGTDTTEMGEPSPEAPKYSLSAPNTPEVREFMNRPEGDSKIVNEDGSPRIYYHGTAQDITEFKPKQANAIFLSPTPSFAEDFTDASEYYMAKQFKEGLSTDALLAFAKKADKLAREFGDSPEDAMNQVLREQLPSRANIIPAYVYANNPFDYENPVHIQQALDSATPAEMQKMLQGASFDPERLKRIFGFGSWNMIESPEAQGAIKRAGFDGFYVTEGGQKNLAVYDSSQIKSAFNKAPTKESKDIRFSVALDSIAPDTFLTSDKNPNALGNLGFMPTNSPFPKRPIRLQIGTRGDEKGKAYGAKHILERALTDVAHRPVAVTKEALEDTILHIESLSKRFNRVYADGKQFILYDAQTDDAMVVTPMNGFYGVTTMYSNPNVQRRYGNPKWSGRNIQPPVEETGLKAQGISVRANEEGDIVQSEVPKLFKQAKAITPNQIEEMAEGQPRKTGTLGVKKKLSLAPNAPPQGTFTTLLPNESAGKRLTDTITNVVDFFKDPERRIKARIAFIDPNSGLARSLKDSPSYDANGVLRADLLARGKAQTINIIRNGLQTGIPIINSDGTVIIQRDDVNNLANSQAIADRLNDNQYVKDSDLSGRGYVAEVARALRGKEIMQEDAAFNKTQKNIKNHVNREKQIKPEQIAWAEQQIKNVPELEQIFDIWKNVNTGLLNLWEEVGLLDKKQADEYRSKKYYVSLAASNADLEEMMENQLGYTAAGLKSTPKIHKLKGSSDLERNIWENIDKQYASMLAGAYQNQVRKVAVEQLIGAGAASIPSRIKNGKTVGAPLAEGINLRYKDPTNPLADNKGVVHVIVDNPVDLAAFETHHYELSPLLKFFGGATNVLRAGALINPMFWIRQLIRDPIHAALVANSGITTPFHSAKEFINVLANNSPEARILAERGVIGQYDSTLDLHTYLEQTGKEQLPKGNLNKLFHKLMQIHEASDASTRIAIFKKEKEAGLNKGMTEEQATNFAVMKARESINFMIHGNSKTLNALRQMIPFLSASITSLDTVYRAATGYNLPPAEKAAAQKLFKQRAALMLGSSIAYAMLMQDDDEYKKLPDYIKDNNWLIKNPLGEGFIKVAVPYEVGFLFKTLPEVAIRGLAGNSTGKEMLKSYKDGFLHNLPTGGVPVPQAIKPALEVITNYSFFTGNPIESIGESRLPIEMRGRNASETAKFLSQSGLGAVGLSPAKIDALMQGYLAEAGTFSFSLADQLITTVQGKEPTSKNLAKQPFFKSFLTDPNSNKAVADFYQIEQTANQVAQEFSTMTKTGLGKEAVELMQDEDKRKLMASAPALRRVATSMTAIRKAIEATNNNQNIPPDDRREMVNKLTAQYNRVAEQGVKLANTLGVR